MAALAVRLTVLSFFPPPKAFVVKGVFSIITYVCATADSITFYCLFFLVIPWELIIEMTLNEKIVPALKKALFH